eukprot:jgi/Ulvmu1/9480/UM052_0049.1
MRAPSVADQISAGRNVAWLINSIVCMAPHGRVPRVRSAACQRHISKPAQLCSKSVHRLLREQTMDVWRQVATWDFRDCAILVSAETPRPEDRLAASSHVQKCDAT